MKHFLSIAAIVRDEEEYLPEWIEFHLLQGVEHFYLCEHEPNGKTLRVLQPYIEEGLVTYSTRRGKKPQLPCYDDILKKHKDESEWIAFIDVDEFLYPSISGIRSIPDLLHELPEYCAIYAVHWVLYGSNGEAFKKGGLVTERFTKRAELPDKHVKSIVRSKFVSVGKNPHAFRKLGNKRILRGSDFSSPLPENYALLGNPVMEPLRLNHYHTKSEYEYRKRRLTPRADNGETFTPQRVDEMFKAHDVNDVQDFSATVWAYEIKERIKDRAIKYG